MTTAILCHGPLLCRRPYNSGNNDCRIDLNSPCFCAGCLCAGNERRDPIVIWQSKGPWHKMAVVIHLYIKHSRHFSCSIDGKYAALGQAAAKLGASIAWKVQ